MLQNIHVFLAALGGPPRVFTPAWRACLYSIKMKRLCPLDASGRDIG